MLGLVAMVLIHGWGGCYGTGMLDAEWLLLFWFPGSLLSDDFQSLSTIRALQRETVRVLTCTLFSQHNQSAVRSSVWRLKIVVTVMEVTPRPWGGAGPSDRLLVSSARFDVVCVIISSPECLSGRQSPAAAAAAAAITQPVSQKENPASGLNIRLRLSNRGLRSHDMSQSHDSTCCSQVTLTDMFHPSTADQ